MAHKEERVSVRVYFYPEERDQLKGIADGQELTLSELIRTTVCKKLKISRKKKVRQSVNQKTALQSEASGIPYGGDKEQMQKRLNEIKEILQNAKKNESDRLPSLQYYQLKAEQLTLEQLLQPEENENHG